jgi:hypothetical protein
MGNVAELKQLIVLTSSVMPRYTQEVHDQVISLLDAITAPEKSEVWKKIGDELLKQAESSSTSNADAYFCLVVGSACVGVSIGLKREENQKAKQA